MTALILTGPIGTEFEIVPRLRRITATDIELAVCRHFKITREEIEGQRRSQRVARPRQLAMALTREMTHLSLPAISNRYGGRDHATCVHAVRRIAELRKSDPVLNEDYSLIRSVLNAEAAG